MSVLLSCLTSLDLSARSDSTKHGRNDDVPESILSISHFNFDHHPDTIVGWMDDELHYLPHLIRWGVCTEDSCASETPKKNRVRETAIIYPDWTRVTGSVSFERLNDDSLMDMLLYLVGHVEDAQGRRDTLRPLVLFGQVSLDEVKEINLGKVEKFQTEPYFAMELTLDVDLRDPKVRDISGRPSYELKRVVLDVKKKEKDTANGPEAPPVAGIESSGGNAVDTRVSMPRVSIHLYPNPSSTETQVEAVPVTPGEYTIEVVALNGIVALRQNVVVTASRSLLSSLDVSELPSGYYALRLHRDDRPIGTYPIIITR